jgi:hypothetical protein
MVPVDGLAVWLAVNDGRAVFHPVQIALGAVHVAQRLHVVVELRRRENGPGNHLQAHQYLVDLDPFDEIVGREDRVAFDVQCPHLVEAPLGDHDADESSSLD